MAQLHFSVDDHTKAALAARAKAEGMSLSAYLASIVRREVADEWPRGYLDAIVGSCAEEPIAEPADLPLDRVEI